MLVSNRVFQKTASLTMNPVSLGPLLDIGEEKKVINPTQQPTAENWDKVRRSTPEKHCQKNTMQSTITISLKIKIKRCHCEFYGCHVKQQNKPEYFLLNISKTLAFQRQAFGAVVKTRLRTLMSHTTRVPGFESQLHYHFSFLLIWSLVSNRWWLKYLDPWHPQGKPGQSSWLWVSPSFNCYRRWGHEQMRDPYHFIGDQCKNVAYLWKPLCFTPQTHLNWDSRTWYAQQPYVIWKQGGCTWKQGGCTWQHYRYFTENHLRLTSGRDLQGNSHIQEADLRLLDVFLVLRQVTQHQTRSCCQFPNSPFPLSSLLSSFLIKNSSFGRTSPIWKQMTLKVKSHCIQ